jgi:hypothetical protein
MKKGTLTVVAKSPKPPPPTLSYGDFDKWIEHADKLVHYLKRIGWEDYAEREPGPDEIKAIYERRRSREQLAAAFDKYFDFDDVWNPASAYIITDGHWELKRDIIAEQIGVLVGSFPYAQPHNPDVYIRMLIEDVAASDPRAPILEGACRWWRRNKNHLPNTAEFLKVLQEQSSAWCDRWGWLEPNIAYDGTNRAAVAKDTLDWHDREIVSMRERIAKLEKETVPA